MTECEKGILTIPTKLSYIYTPHIKGSAYEEPVDEVFEITSMMLYGIDVCEYIKEYDMWQLEGAILKKIKGIAMIEENVDQRNSMFPPYLAHDFSSNIIPITQQEIQQACKEREKLQNIHRNDCLIDLWEDLV